nr:hypothetical protein [Tanacetum cinerariifolium]
WGITTTSPTLQGAAVVFKVGSAATTSVVLGGWPLQEIGSLLISTAAVVANPPPTAYHGGGNSWKSRRCCCGLGGVGGVVVTSGVDVAVAMGLLWWMVAGVRWWYDGDGSRRWMMMAEGWPNLGGGCCHGGAGGSGVIGGVGGA